MDQLTAILRAHPDAGGHPSGRLEAIAAAARELDECALVCVACADACLAEHDPGQMRTCIALDLDCAAICRTTASVLLSVSSDRQEVQLMLLRACYEACRTCAQECDRFADVHDHCRLCAQTCHRCAELCRCLLAELGESERVDAGVPAHERP